MSNEGEIRELKAARDSWRNVSALAETLLDRLSHASAAERRTAGYKDKIYAARTELADARAAVAKMPRARDQLIIRAMASANSAPGVPG